MSRGVVRDVDNRFSKPQTLKEGLTWERYGAMAPVESPAAAVASKIMLVEDCGKVFSDKNRTAGSTVSITLPSVGLCIGRTATLIHERASNAASLTAFAPASGEKILGQTADKSLHADDQGDSIVLLGTAAGWAIISKNGTWTEET